MGRQTWSGLGISAAIMALLCLPALAGAAGAATGEAGICVSRNGAYEVHYRSELNPLRINTLHAWVLQVQTAGGKPVNDAVIEIEGGMPRHDHGLPTQPQVVATPGQGNYRIEGLRFHMQGEWQLSLTIRSGQEEDSCVVSLQL
jgi:hypothetical protein